MLNASDANGLTDDNTIGKINKKRKRPPSPADTDIAVTPGAAAPKEDFKAYDVDTPARAPAEAAPTETPAADEWSAFADAEPPGCRDALCSMSLTRDELCTKLLPW